MLKSTETLASLAYARNSDGEVTSTTSKGVPGEEKTSDEYDPNNRLTKGGATAYEYDAANNPTKIATGAYKYNAGDELETGPSLTYSYNEVGERTKTTPSTGPATTYGYDEAGNLISVERPKEGEVSKIEDTYAYNGEGLRASQTISGTTSYLAWDMTEELPLILGDGTNSYIYGPGGLPVEQINNTTGTVTYLHHDQAGSTRLLTSSAGTVTGKCTYSPYGTPTCEGTTTTPLGYDGQYTSSDTGLIYMRARVYDPATAQFLTVDPAVSVTRAPYNYADDNPLRYRDRSGLGWEEDLEGPGVPNPWSEAEHASEELLRPGVEAVEHGAENAWHAINENEQQGDEGEAELRTREAERESACSPTPPGYDPDTWTKGPASRAKEPGENYFDPEGGEWHYHPPDKYHEVPHWDHKPPFPWNAEWERIPIP